MSEKRELLIKIQRLLSDQPLSISAIKDKLNIDWRTAKENLETLKDLGLVYERKNHKTIFYLRDKNNYFELPTKNQDKKKISTIYYHIKQFCSKKFNKEPTKTQAYKIIWKVNKKFNLGLPIGWYMFGPICAHPYTGQEHKIKNLNSKHLNFIKKMTEEYCILDNIELQKKVYSEENNMLYKAKERLYDLKQENKEKLNLILMDLIKYAPKETIDVTTDFARATLLLNWEKTKTIFETFWRYITLVVFKKSLRSYYQDNINIYLTKKIEEAKKEAQLEILNLVNNHTDTKYSQDKLYQRWVKKKK